MLIQKFYETNVTKVLTKVMPNFTNTGILVSQDLYVAPDEDALNGLIERHTLSAIPPGCDILSCSQSFGWCSNDCREAVLKDIAVLCSGNCLPELWKKFCDKFDIVVPKNGK